MVWTTGPGVPGLPTPSVEEFTIDELPRTCEAQPGIAIMASYVHDPARDIPNSPHLSWILAIGSRGDVSQWVLDEFLHGPDGSRIRCRKYRACISPDRVSKLLKVADGIGFFDIRDRFDPGFNSHNWLAISVNSGSRFHELTIDAPAFQLRYPLRLYAGTLPIIKRFWKTVVAYAPVQMEDGLLH
jgi:hypothetical protein